MYLRVNSAMFNEVANKHYQISKQVTNAQLTHNRAFARKMIS